LFIDLSTRFQILAAVKIDILAFWVKNSPCVVGGYYFGGLDCLHLQVRSVDAGNMFFTTLIPIYHPAKC
jgi:hypothetical protein